ncbi:hypothetical protein V8C86DRAFT_3095592 [Haematococcus lacustris]
MTRVTYIISPAIFTLLCSNATARTTFADDSASALAAQLTRSSGTAVSVAGSVPASACGRRMRALLQASPTFPVNYLITFPLGTAAATQDSQVRSLVTRINTEGVVALGVVRLGPVEVADITAVAEVVPTMTPEPSSPFPPPPSPDPPPPSPDPSPPSPDPPPPSPEPPPPSPPPHPFPKPPPSPLPPPRKPPPPPLPPPSKAPPTTLAAPSKAPPLALTSPHLA